MPSSSSLSSSLLSSSLNDLVIFLPAVSYAGNDSLILGSVDSCGHLIVSEFDTDSKGEHFVRSLDLEKFYPT